MIENIETVDQMQKAVQLSEKPVMSFGGGTKTCTETHSPESVRVCRFSDHKGITIYTPSEFLITARNGTKIAEIQSALKEHGQYLPFDPQFVQQGATLGGTVASGISGCDRLLYGGLRDFVMEVQFIDGLAKLVRGGGKVVKNAAGFDFPKLMVGSLGRLGILTEITMKVFPEPPSFASCIAQYPNIEDCLEVSQVILGEPLPTSSMDIDACDDGTFKLLMRFGGPSTSLPKVCTRAQSLASTRKLPAQWQVVPQETEHSFWRERELPLQPESSSQHLMRIGLSPRELSELDRQANNIGIVNRRYGAGGTVGWYQCESNRLAPLSELLSSLGLSSISAANPIDSLVLAGNLDWCSTASRIQKAVDPKGRFLAFAS